MTLGISYNDVAVSHPVHFYKFCTAQVAQLMLETCRVRWSGPLCYNDPFDCHFSLTPKFDLNKAAREVSRRFFQIIFAETRPTFNEANPFARHMDAFRGLASTVSETEMKRRMGDFAAECVRSWQAPEGLVQAQWREAIARYRLFCVCERKDNLLLWSHYADSHKGVAFELDGTAEMGIPLSAALPVVYSKTAPSMHTRKDWIDAMLGLIPLADGRAVWERLVTTKARAWAYEKEWRLLLSRRDHEEESLGYADRPFDPSNVSGIFLGCKIPQRGRDVLLSLATGPFAHVKVYQTRQARTKFALEFERVR